MKKIICLFVLLLSVICFSACKKDDKEIVVGATPSPHAEILNSDAVQNYIKSKGYTLTIKVYQDYVTPNKALNDGGIDANYFQHMPYLTSEIEEKGYAICAACYVHNEPLNLYGSTNLPEDYNGLKIYTINDASNAERAFALLKANGFIDTYDFTDFDPLHPVYTSSCGVTIECLDSGLLNKKVDEGGFAVIPGNYALTAWGAIKAANYKILGESTEVAYPNLIACRTEDLNSEKIKVLVEALSQKEVKDFIEATYGPTVAYSYKDLR